MKKIGLTGGIGSGKSTIANVFNTLGVPVYDSDKEAKTLINADQEIKLSLVSLLGAKAYKNGQYDRQFVADQVFQNKEKLNQLNAIVHPVVRNHFKEWCNDQLKKNTQYVIKEAAILFESGANNSLDKVICVTAPEVLRIARVVSRDRTEPLQVQQRIDNQLSEEERISLSDYRIDNAGNVLVVSQVLEIHKSIIDGCFLHS
jgi:dephospho-CoA kinase